MSIDRLANLSIQPYEGVGCFKLGQSLFQVVQILQENQLKCKIVTDFQMCNSVPTLIIIEEFGLKLYFNSFTQILTYIEIYQFNKVLFSRNDNILNPDYRLPNLQKIYNKIFGPTYAGSLDEEDNYTLSYEGIAFKFDLKNYVNSSKKLVQFVNDNSQQIYCHSIQIFYAKSVKEFNASLDTLFIRAADFVPKEKPIDSVVLHPGSRRATVCCGGVKHVFRIGHNTMQDVVMALGAPQDSLTVQNLRYHNYFKFGLDFCYDISEKGTILQRVNCHNNSINSFEFMKYEKSNWSIQLQGDKISSSDKFEVLKKHIPEVGEPVFLNRNEYDLVNSLTKKFEHIDLTKKKKGYSKKDRRVSSPANFELINYEVEDDDLADAADDDLDLGSEDDVVASTSNTSVDTELMKDRSKDWGLTNLYCFQNFIFEVLIDTDNISMVTLL